MPKLFSVLIVAAALLAGLPAALADVTLHVSPAGRDTWSGRPAAPNARRTDGPLASLQGARDRVRALRAAGRLQGPVTVRVRGGTYRLQEPLLLMPADSGTKGAPVVYAAAAGEKPVISGGRPITGWRQDGPRWVATLPEVKADRWLFRQLFVDGKRRQRARTPNAGFFQVEGPIENTWQWGKPRAEAKPSVFKYRGEDVRPEWGERGDVEVVALQAWAEVRMQIRSVDAAAKRVTLAGACAPSNREGNARYWIENAPECLDAPGEWYLDRGAGVLTYWPLPGEVIGKTEVVAPALTTLVRFAGAPEKGDTVHDVVFRGLTFCHADWSFRDDTPVDAPSVGSATTSGAFASPQGEGYCDLQAAFDIPAAVAGVGAVDCAFERCTIRGVGRWAVAWGRGCKGNRLDRCELTDLGAGGVKIGEAEQRKEPAEHASGNSVSHCRIHDIGIVYPAAIGVWIGQAYDNRVSHCAIYDTCYSAVSVGWTWGYGPTLARGNVVEFNHLYNISRGWLSDLGAVYTLGTQPGTVIRNNVVHDVESYGYGGWGLYTDEGSSGIVLENNVIYRTKSGGFHQHYGKENVVRNNVFALAREGQIIRSREEKHRSFTFEHNIVLFSQGSALGGNWNNDQFACDHNVYWDLRKAPVRLARWSLEEWQTTKKQDAHSLVADPLFVDALRGDFRLQPDSPALKIGFQPLDLAAVGPEVDPPAAFAPAGPRGSTSPLPAFAWQPSEGADRYVLVVSRRPDLAAPLLTATVSGATRYTPPDPLPDRTPLYWGVAAENRRGKIAMSGGPLRVVTDRPIPWWDRAWACRRRVVLAPPALSAALPDFPLLVRLDAADTELWQRTQPGGRDLRVVTEGEDGRLRALPCEVAGFDAAGHAGRLWVRLPQLLPGGQHLWLYFGNARARPAGAPGLAWEPGFRGVWHLDESAFPLRDSTSWGAHLAPTGAPAAGSEGVAGPALRFTGKGDRCAAPDGEQFKIATGSLSCWVRAGHQPDGAMLLNMGGILLQAWFTDKVNPGVNTPSGWGGHGWVPESPVLDDAWHHLALTYDGRKQCYYVDGEPAGDKGFSGEMLCTGAGLNLGGVPEGRAFAGALDEVHLSGVPRSPDWVRAAYENQRPGGTFVHFRSSYPQISQISQIGMASE